MWVGESECWLTGVCFGQQGVVWRTWEPKKSRFYVEKWPSAKERGTFRAQLARNLASRMSPANIICIRLGVCGASPATSWPVTFRAGPSCELPREWEPQDLQNGRGASGSMIGYFRRQPARPSYDLVLRRRDTHRADPRHPTTWRLGSATLGTIIARCASGGLACRRLCVCATGQRGFGGP